MKAEGGVAGLSTSSKPCSNGITSTPSSTGIINGTMSAIQLLHKIKVKEEVGCATASSGFGSISSRRAHSPATTSTSTTATTISGPAIGAVATVTISSAQPEQPASCTTSVAASCGSPDSDLPVDLDLKTRLRGSTRESRTSTTVAQTNGSHHQPQSQQHSRRSRSPFTPSPSSSPGSSNTHNHQNRQKSQSQSTTSVPNRSPDHSKNDDRTIPHTGPPILKTEAGITDDGNLQISHEDGSSSTTTITTPTRCSSIIFAADESLKRLLGTTLQFAMKLSPDTGDTVKSLVIGLLSGSVSTEEFHTAVQEVTNYPLREHVLPCLKQTLPSLQRDLNAAARADNQVSLFSEKMFFAD
ncbi:hypothetical protein QAD02_004614 [Eretmocerus hayati]|uniref:Uncharacterized protein n=1 Tax=Eretmocerus hayati TaxID=131215 RepID=A0ACC2NQI1_9HYME|nr:hypothetical protein QAD02_004614 [Eretmocerus hayati]